MKTSPHPLAFLAVVLLAGCAALGLSTPQTFNQKLLGGYSTVTEVRSDATVLVGAGKLSPDDAQNVQDQATNLRAGLDVARTVSKTDPTAAVGKLTATITALTALQAYLATKKGN